MTAGLQAMAAKCGRKFAIACANGTAALDIAVKAAGIGEGDEARESLSVQSLNMRLTSQLGAYLLRSSRA